MAIQHCSSFSLETLQGVHDFDNDTIKMALFGPSASFDSDTTTYTTTGELASVEGYAVGGNTLTLTAGYPQLEDGYGSVRFDETSWTFTEPKTIRYGLIYNQSKANRAIASIDFSLTEAYSGDFTVRFPLSLRPVVQHTFSLG